MLTVTDREKSYNDASLVMVLLFASEQLKTIFVANLFSIKSVLWKRLVSLSYCLVYKENKLFEI